MSYLETLRLWAASPAAEKDLQSIFGEQINWVAAYRHLEAFRRGDFSQLPPIEVLEAVEMLGLWGGYSRDLRRIFLSADCPEDLQTAVLLEEIGHFLDQELCTEETPGEEGAHFASLVLGSPCRDYFEDESLRLIHFGGKAHLVEAAPKVRGSAKTKATPAPKVKGKVVAVIPDTTTSQDGNVVYANKDSVRITQTKAGQRVIGSKGNDTFVVSSQNVRLEDPNGGTDTVEAKVSFSLANFSFIENLTAESGTSALSLTGNSKANIITGNNGNNVLDGGVDSQKDTLIGGAGNDTYIIRDTLDVIIDTSGTDVIFTTNQSLSVSSYTNIERICFIGTDGADSMFGGAGAGTLLGGKGNDTYFVDHVGDAVSETDSSTLTGGVDWVNARISHALGSNVENIFKSGNFNASLTGNGLANIIDGSAGAINTLSGGAGNDTLIVNVSRIGKVDGGANTDWLKFSGNSLSLNNVALTSIEALDLTVLTGNAAVTLGGNSTALDTILGGVGADSITAVAGFGNQTITLDGGAGDDRFAFSSVAQMSAASLFGGEGTDRLAFTSSISNLVDADLSNLGGSEIEVLELNGSGNGVTLGPTAEAAGISTIFGGVDNDTIDASGYEAGIVIDVSRNKVAEDSNEDTVLGGAAGDLIIFSNHNVMAASSINGNDGLDTLAFAEDGVAITDDKFLGNISNVEVLQTADGTNFIQIGTNAESSGLESIIGGADSDTFDAAEFNSDIAIDAGDGDDSITLQNSARVATSTIEGGLGNDTLSIWEAGALADEDLINVTGIENLQAAESESSSIVLGQIAKAAGIQAVVAGIDNDILDARDFSGTLVLDGGEGDDHFFVSAGFDLRQKVVIGGIGSDTLSFTTNQLSVTDADFVGVDAVEYFKTANGNNRVVLGSSAQSAGISTIEGGTGRDTLSVAGFGSDVTLIGGAEKSSLVGGSGNDSLFGNNGNDVLNGGDGIDTMVGGLGDDTYYIGDDGDWAIEGVDSGNNLLIVDQEVELFNTVSGGGATTFTIQGLDSIAGTNGDDSITGNTSSLNNAGQVMKTTSLNDTIDGGDGNDTIAGGRGKDSILGGNNNDSILGEEGNDALRGDDGNDTILAGDGNDSVVGGDGNDSLLAGAGNDTLFGEAGNDTLKADATGSATLDGGTDDDTFQFSSAAQIAASSIVGGAGTGDEIVLTKGSIFSDADFSKVSGVEIFDASVQEASRVSLGGNALRAGIAILIGSDNNADFLSAAQYTSEQITITAGSGSTQDTLVAGSGRNKSSLVGNAGANYFEVGLASLLGNHTIDGGAGIDSLSIERIAYGEGGTSDSSDIEDSLIGGDQLFTDSLFKYTSNIDAIYYNNRYFNSLVLGDDFASIFGSNQTASIFSAEDTYPDLINDDASDYIDLSRITSKKVYLDVNHERFGATIIGGQDENTLVGGRKSTADDLFIFQNANWLVNSKIVGGGGNDTLRVGGNVQDINSSNFDIDIDVLDITGAGNKITLSGNSGITTIIGGSGPNTLDASSYDLGNKTLAWDMRRSIGGDSLLGGIQGNLFQLKNDANLQNSIITGNTGEDTIQIVSGAETLGDAVFDNTSNAEVLMLGSAANGNNITLGSIAEGVGISTVIGGTARETIDASAYAAAIYIDASASSGARLQGSSTSNANILIGGSLGGNEFEIGDLGSNTIVGGSGGLDTLTFVSANTVINDTDDTDGKIGGSSAALSNIGVLRFLGDNNDITLGKDALAAGILTLVGGEGGDLGSNFDTSRYNTVGVLFQITDQFYLRNSNITGSLGVDTLKFSRDGVSVTDEIVTNLSNIDIIQTANGNNRFLFDNDYLTAGIETIIGGTGRDTIDMADIGLYTPATDDDIITMDLSAGSGYTLISTAQNFAFAKVIGSATNEGSVIIDGLILTDEDFEHMYQGNIGSLFMRVGSDNFVTLGENALASGLDILTMSSGDDIIDASGFAGTLAINGGDGDDIVRTSFAALSNLTYTGGGGVDTLRLTGAEARSFTSLAGNFEALALNAGNNFVILANDASLSAIHGGTGIDTISMLSNTTGINFVMNAARLGNTAGFASLDGGSGNDTLTVHNVLTPFLDTQFARVGSVSWAEDIGAIENFVTENAGGESYTFGTTAYAAGIQNVYVHNGDILDASNFFDLAGDPATDRALNFVFATAGDAAAADITGSGANANDTLTLTDDDQTVDNATFANKTSVETLVLANGTNTVTLNANAAAAGIEVVVGGAGNDALTFDTTLQTALILNGGAQTTFDSAIISNAGATFGDGYFEDWSSVERLTTANGNNNITLGVNAVTAGIATITGGTGNDTFNASAYTIAATLIGGDGNDSMLSGSTSDSLTGGAGDDTFYGGAGNDFISGGDDADFICGASTLTGGSNEIDTLTGDAGNDTFVLGDATNAYYNTATNAGDYALIRDFDAANDQLQLRDLTGGANPNGGYLFGAAIYGAIGGANSYLYVDTDASNTVNTGDNLVAAISSSVALTTADLTNPARVSII